MQKVTIFEAFLDTLSFYRNFLHNICFLFAAIYLFTAVQRKYLRHDLN